MTTSNAESDVVKSYELHASCYLTKPVEFDDFARLVSSINEFWIKNVKFPLHGSGE